MKTSSKRSTPSKPRVTEAHVQKAVTDLLVADGWRAIRTNWQSLVREVQWRLRKLPILFAFIDSITKVVESALRACGLGEVGMPDYLFIRYDLGWTDMVIWIEFKALGEKPSPHQKRWHDKERMLGAEVMVVDDIDKFISWYRTSGLARKVLQDGTKSKDRR